MTINKAIITPAESDVILANEADWKDLADGEKTRHIGFASTYVQLSWACSLIDWADDTTIPEVVDEAVAYFALASSRGTLYQSTEEPAATSKVQEKTSQLGGLKSTVKYSTDDSSGAYPLQYPDALMDSVCTRSVGAGSVKAVRF